MFLNYLLWVLFGFLIGTVGYLKDKNGRKVYVGSLAAGFFGAFIGGMFFNFVISSVGNGEINYPALLVSIIFSYVFVKFESDYF